MQITLENYPDLREATREFSGQIRRQISSFLDTMKYNYRPAATFGQFVTVGQKETPKDASANLAQLKAHIKDVVSVKPFTMNYAVPEILEFNFGTPRLWQYSYAYTIETKSGLKVVTVSKPLAFVLSFPDHPFSRLAELVQMRDPSSDEMKAFILHYSVLNFLITRSKPVMELFEALRFRISTERFPEFGALPITIVSPPAGTVRLPDSIIAHSIRQSGVDAVEEVLDVDAWNNLRDPLLDQFHTVADELTQVSGVTV
jgi:hypothetical protein